MFHNYIDDINKVILAEYKEADGSQSAERE